jgi:hypothetical protein
VLQFHAERCPSREPRSTYHLIEWKTIEILRAT